MKFAPVFLASFALAFGSGCGFTTGQLAPADSQGLLSRAAAWLKKDSGAKAGSQSPSGGNGITPRPQPQKYPVGSVHLVQTDGKFVLIRTGSRLMEVSPEGELMTYDQAGRPTGKLKLSPERKSGFLAADIVEGAPKTGDRVVWFGEWDGSSGRTADPFRQPAAGEPVEVLE